MEPGSRKSAVHRDATAPLLAYERELIEAAAPMVADTAGRRRIAEQRLAKAEKRAADASGPEARDAELEARSLAVEVAEMPAPTSPRLYAADATPEAIASMMAANGGNLSVLSAESGIFGMMAGRYSKAPDLDIFLKGHAGDEHRVDRRGRPSEIIEAAVLTLGLAVQPYVLRQAAANTEFVGRGLLDRFLYALPVPTVGYRRTRPETVPEELVEAYRRAVIDLGRTMRSYSEPMLLTFDAEALATFEEWSAELEPRRRPHADLGPIAGWSSKLDGAAVRLAGLLHLAETSRQNRQNIPGRTVLAALAVSDYLAAHAQAVFGMMRADPRLEDARHVARWIRSTHRERFTRREAHRAAEHRFATVDDLLPALAELEARAYVRRIEAEPRPGRPSPAYAVNPAVLAIHPQYRQNPERSAT
jgi:hypothetical protein